MNNKNGNDIEVRNRLISGRKQMRKQSIKIIPGTHALGIALQSTGNAFFRLDQMIARSIATKEQCQSIFHFIK